MGFQHFYPPKRLFESRRLADKEEKGVSFTNSKREEEEYYEYANDDGEACLSLRFDR
jgi:hypothetical protein